MINKIDEFPKNWYVIVDKNNLNILSKWRFGNNNSKLSIDDMTGMVKMNNGTTEKGHNPEGCFGSDNGSYKYINEISFNDFRKFVLNETIEPEIIEDYSYLIKILDKLGIK